MMEIFNKECFMKGFLRSGVIMSFAVLDTIFFLMLNLMLTIYTLLTLYSGVENG